MSNTFDKLSVLDSFIEEVNSYLPEIETNLGRLALSTDDMEALEESYRRAHTIGGSASMMDFPGLAHVAHGMEDILGDVLDNLAKLDPPTLGLLQRSLQRLHRLVDGIRGGIDEDAVIAEDDADYTQYRAQVEMSIRSTEQDDAGAESLQEPTAPAQSFSPAAMPSLDEMLASFRSPGATVGEEVPWPEDPVPLSSADVRSQQDTQPRQPVPTASAEPEPPSALEILAAPASNAPDRPPVTPNLPVADVVETVPAPAPVDVPAKSVEVAPLAVSVHVPVSIERSSISPVQAELPVAQVYQKMQLDARGVEDQVVSLKRTLTQLRLTAAIVEAQRGEFKGFLDGSKDALDRMEEWAGKAMGLNLRNSPEQVRRYLPLSVMWVANNKLKKVLDLLTQMTGNMEMTEEQMQASLVQLQMSIEACGDAIDQLQAAPSAQAAQHDQTWTPWQMQIAQDAVRERVTFERRGDIAALRAEVEAQVRQEYAQRSTTMATRAELERQIRGELREEFESRRQIQESVVGAGASESLQEMEARLRQEIEIAVRSEFLSTLTGEADEAMAQTAGSMGQLFAPVAPAPVSSPMPMLNATAYPNASPTAYTSPQTADFGEEAAEIFRLEAEEHLQTISMFVAALENTPTDLEPIQGIRRATHTLKGAAGMMGFRAIADLCHISEDLLVSVIEETIPITPAVLSLILDTAEALDLLINEKGASDESAAAVEALRKRYAEILGEQPSLAQVMNEELDSEIEASEAVILEDAPVTNVVDASLLGTSMQQMVRNDLSVRVPLTKLDELVNLFGELLVNRSILEERLQRLMRLVSDAGVSSTRLRDVGQKLESRFEAATLPSGRSVQVMPGQGNSNGHNGRSSNGRAEPAHLAEFDELELDRYTEFHQLARGLSEGISDMTTLSNEMDAIIRDCESVFSRENRLNTTFQDRLMKARLVPLSTMIPRLYRTARAVALKQHKEFEFVLEGQETEVDRTVIEEIAGPLLHLMRNAVNHAIEIPEARRQQGKAPAGQIKLSAAYEGNQVVITVRDDGTGIDSERVRRAALADGFIHPDQQLSEGDIIELIFRPGFSTAEVLSEESGRGVGLDVVRDSVSRLRGTLEVESTPGQGTAFTMKFPTSLAIQSAMMVLVGEQQYAIPTVMVEAIGRLDNFKQSMFGGRPAIIVQNDFYPLIMLSQLLDLPVSPPDDKAPVLLVRTDRHRVALVVDSIKGKLDVVMKNLGPHLRHVHGIAGGTVLGNGRVVLILELIELLAPRLGTPGAALAVPTSPPLRREGGAMPALLTAVERAGAAPANSTVTPRGTTVTTTPVKQNQTAVTGKHVLVVDDSPSVRRVVGNMLKQNGWEVQLARDGVEALEMISRETPAAVLLDIEMPRMDGYELMATVRAQEQYRTLPLVVLTSRAASKHQQRAMQLGASAYVVKPYQDEEMLTILKSLVYGATV
ncbi:MAG TPA: Hpt domain-containing protein [Ktedonobacteraceae bacterium]|nr:Hpt domain-containing protein [Ktedonobacteraceae bacterium]